MFCNDGGGEKSRLGHAICRIFFLSFVLVFFGIVSACGIDEYIYFAPVSNYSFYSSEERTIFSLPGSSVQDNVYCTSYILYYRIYKSTEYYDWPTSSDFSLINPQLSKDYAAITTNTDDESKILSSISYLENNFSITAFFPPSIDSQSIILDATKINALSKDYLGTNFFGSQFKIDFNLTVNEYFHPVMSYYALGSDIPTNIYRIAREYLSDIPADRRDFLDPSFIQGSDTVVYSETIEGNYAYVLFYISAYGINFSELSTVNSAPCYLGVFKIDGM